MFPSNYVEEFAEEKVFDNTAKLVTEDLTIGDPFEHRELASRSSTGKINKL